MDTFERRWRLLLSLLAGPKTRRAILDELDLVVEDDRGLSGGTLSGDVKALREAGIAFRPLTADDKKTKQAYELDWGLVPVFASPEEAEALKAGADVLGLLNLPQAKVLERMLERVPEPVRERSDEIGLEHLLPASQSPYHAELFQKLKQGIREARPMWIGYKPVNKEPRRFLVDKAHFVWQEGSLYLYAYCPREAGSPDCRKNREFRLDRFVAVDGGPVVELVKGGKVSRAELPSFELELWVSPAFVPRFRAVPGEMRLSDAPDGGKYLKIREVSPLRAVRRVLSYGEHVRVIGPDFVKEDLAGAIARMAEALEA